MEGGFEGIWIKEREGLDGVGMGKGREGGGTVCPSLH